MQNKELEQITLVECPRDAMQGIKNWIPTDSKVKYINTLLKAGFHTLDFGSFVSPKAIPQMADTVDVLHRLDWKGSNTELLAIVANPRGAENASRWSQIKYLGYPFSISETFQLRNTNATIAESLDRVSEIQSIALDSGKELVIYISMGFGNPYGDPWNAEVVFQWAEKLHAMGVRILSLSDTIGVSTPDSIHYLFSRLIPSMPDIVIGAHLHTTPFSWSEKLEAALAGGCRRFDGALRGFGGCPMAKDELTGNMPMEQMIYHLEEKGYHTGIDHGVLEESLDLIPTVFSHG